MAELILILAPRGRDAPVIQQALERAGIASSAFADLDRLCAGLDDAASALIVTEEALAGAGLENLLGWCEAQPPWSDLPVIVLATRQVGHRSRMAAATLERLGNVVLLERPVNSETLLSATRSSLRVRRRQHQARAFLQEREQRENTLRELNETLERRVAERTAELDGARETLDFALQSAEMGSWDLDLLRDSSRRTLQHDRIFGYADAQAGWGITKFLAHVLDEDRPTAEAAFAAARRSGLLDLECRIRRTDGAIRWIVAKGRIGYDEIGQAVRMAGVVMDNTDRRFTEDALHQAQKMEAIGQLTGGVAHDFNNLLTVVVGALELVMRAPANTDRVRRLAEAAMTAARRGEQLTQQLLAFSRRQMLRPQTVDPNRLLIEVEALAQRAVGEAVTLRFDLDGQAGAILIDPAQFESAVLNLVVNARDAMAQGGTVRVSSCNAVVAGSQAEALDLAPGDYVCIAVADTGSGIDSATLARVFEPFFTTKEVGKGSGLGLSQVYGFMRSAGGTVDISSIPGEGTVVRLYFPRSGQALADEEPTQAGGAAPRDTASGETVLLVEDDEQVRAMAVESLRELRYEVIVASNAREALAHIHRKARIDVMFSDVVMPGGMNGTQLAAEARRVRPELKVLLTSGYVGERPQQEPVADEMGLLSKPYRRDDLARRLRVVLGKG